MRIKGNHILLGPVFYPENKRARIIAHLHMRIVNILRVGQSARILPIHV